MRTVARQGELIERCVLASLPLCVYVIIRPLTGAARPLRKAVVDDGDHYWLDKMSFSSGNTPTSDGSDTGGSTKLKGAVGNYLNYRNSE